MDGTGAAARRAGAVRLSDPRAQRSRLRLHAALLEAVRERPFAALTLREIAAAAQVSYPTVFNHYESKDALFQDVAREEIGGLLDAFRQGRDEPGWRPGRGIVSHVLARRELWHTLLTTGAAEAMRSEFIRRGRALAQDHAPLGHGVPVDVVSSVIAGGVFEIVAWWLGQLQSHPAAPPVEDVAVMLEQMVIEPALNLPRGFFADVPAFG